MSKTYYITNKKEEAVFKTLNDLTFSKIAELQNTLNFNDAFTSLEADDIKLKLFNKYKKNAKKNLKIFKDSLIINLDKEFCTITSLNDFYSSYENVETVQEAIKFIENTDDYIISDETDSVYEKSKFLEILNFVEKERINTLKNKIDNMSHEEMAKLHRFGDSSNEFFQRGEIGDYFSEKFKKYGGMTPTISKKIGW